MEPKDDHGYSDLEVEQVRAVVLEEFGSTSPSWVLRDVTRRLGQPDVIDVTIQSVMGERVLKLVLPHQEFEGENPANSSSLTDTVFNISIRLVEFLHIRGLDEFENGARFPLVIYPENRTSQRTGPPEPGWVAKAPLRPDEP